MRQRITTGEELLALLDEVAQNPEAENIFTRESDAMIRDCAKILANKMPVAQGYTLAELTCAWINAHNPPEIRERILAIHIALVRAGMSDEEAVPRTH